jgi:lipopolysaccharide transport system permease protein
MRPKEDKVIDDLEVINQSRGSSRESCVLAVPDSINLRDTRMPTIAAETSGVVTVYTPDSPLRQPVRFLREMFHDLRSSRELAWRLFIRDTSAQYRQSVLGYLWAFLPPLIASLPFVFLNSQGVIGIQGTTIPYPAYALIGTIIWQVFVDALNSPLKTVIAAKSMLVRINLPREAILLSGLGQVVFSFLIRLVLLILTFIWFKLVPPATVLLFPIGVFALMLFGFTLGVVLTPLGLLYTDVQQILPIATTCLMLLTPVIYPPPAAGLAATVSTWNPISPLIIVTRNWITTGDGAQIGAFCFVTVAAIFLLFAGWIVYRLALPHVVSRLGG